MFRQSYYDGRFGHAGARHPRRRSPSSVTSDRACVLRRDVRALRRSRRAPPGASSADLGSALATLAVKGIGSERLRLRPSTSVLKRHSRRKPRASWRTATSRRRGSSSVMRRLRPAAKTSARCSCCESLLAGAFERSSTTSLGFRRESPSARSTSTIRRPRVSSSTSTAPRRSRRWRSAGCLLVSRSLTLKPLGADALKRFKAAAEGQFLTDSVNLSRTARICSARCRLKASDPDSINGGARRAREHHAGSTCSASRKNICSATSSRSSFRGRTQVNSFSLGSVALVHDYLNQRGGAERVFRHVADLYPDAPVYTSLFDARIDGRSSSPRQRVRTSSSATPPRRDALFSLSRAAVSGGIRTFRSVRRTTSS